MAALGLSRSAWDRRCLMQNLLFRHMRSLGATGRHSGPVECGISVIRLGINPACPALQSGFLTTGQPGNSQETDLSNFHLPWMSTKIKLHVNLGGFCTEEIHINPLSSKKIMVIVLLPSRILTAFVSTAGILSRYSLFWCVEFSLLNSLGIALPFC